MDFYEDYNTYRTKMQEVFALHSIEVDRKDFEFTNEAVELARAGRWELAVGELSILLDRLLSSILNGEHKFLDAPTVRHMSLSPTDDIYIAIMNEQSKSWYGSDFSIGSFDFLLEDQRGILSLCRRFLDLGAHQLVWSIFYAKRSSDAVVSAFEPSVLNVAIGLFNCLMNGVVRRVNVIPFAAKSSLRKGDCNETKMLVDYISVQVKAVTLSALSERNFDFVKVDIEGYEFELLGCPQFREVLAECKSCHLELHLGHLFHTGVRVSDWVDVLRHAEVRGTELYSETDIFKFLQGCDPRGFYSFLVERKPDRERHRIVNHS